MTEHKWLINAGKNKRYYGTAHVLDKGKALCKQQIITHGYPIRLGIHNHGVVAESIEPDDGICPNCERIMEAKGYMVKDGKWVQRFTAS